MNAPQESTLPSQGGSLLDQSAIPKYTAAFVLLFTVLAVQRFISSRKLSRFPNVNKLLDGKDKSYFNRATDVWNIGYDKYRDTIWRYSTPDADHLVVPIRYAEELRKMPDDVIDVKPPQHITFQSEFTFIQPDDHLLQALIKADLTPTIPHLVGPLADEATRTVTEGLGPCDDWTDYPLYHKMVEFVAIVSGSVFVGTELSRRPEYLDAAINYTYNSFGAADSLKTWPVFLRKVAGSFLDTRVSKLREHRKRVLAFLMPYVQKRMALRDQGGDDIPNDMIQWAVNRAPKLNMDTPEKIANTLGLLGMVAVHTTAINATQPLFDIVAHCPEVIPELRKEITSVLEANGGVFTAKAVADMKLMDSILKESQRLNPSIWSSFSRWVGKDVTLSDGAVIPKNVIVTTAFKRVTLDEEYYPDANRFNPYRFVDIRSGKVDDPLQYKNKEQYQFISATKEFMAFGYGRHACPGRFFAGVEIKLILAAILMNYDVKLPKGVKGRYEDLKIGDMINPDPSNKLSFRKIQ
ncbi:cytochrome P450 [Colletotrichum zoysiae]|uniref:Cytochrome P450 n=1 Tax=Colletotrichum zoysiae TaxID=1216348 RepID=A0AAD9LZ78_9PEZI|nr:cytochrome P450 [Colletotrichum zoysiae]